MFIYVHWRTTPYPGARTSPSGVKHGDSPYLHASSLPICTPPASIHIHSLFSVLSPKPSCAGLLWGLSQYHWCWSPVQLGLRWRVNLPPRPPAEALHPLPAPSPPQAAPRVSVPLGRGLQPEQLQTAIPNLQAGSGPRLSLLLLLAAHVWLCCQAINPQREAAIRSRSN